MPMLLMLMRTEPKCVTRNNKRKKNTKQKWKRIIIVFDSELGSGREVKQNFEFLNFRVRNKNKKNQNKKPKRSKKYFSLENNNQFLAKWVIFQSIAAKTS